MTWNVEWMFDNYRGDNRSELSKKQSAASKEIWEGKVAGVAGVVASAKPEIVALQEIESDQTLAAIVEELRSRHDLSYRYAFIQGSDSFTEQDVGILFRSGMISYRRHEQSKAMFESGRYYNLSKHLAAEFRWSDIESPLTLFNVHLRATAAAEHVRVRQARLARHWVEPMLAAGQDVVVLGDFNSETHTGERRSDTGVMLGDGSGTAMVDLLTRLDDPTTSTHLILDRQFDRLFVSPSLIEDGPGRDWSFESIHVLTQEVIRGSRDGHDHWDNPATKSPSELDISDHFPVVAKFILR